MTDDEYAIWHEAQLRSYAAEMVASGMLDEVAARDRAEQQTAQFLPDGLATANTSLLRILDADGAPVGALWMGPHPSRPNSGFVYDIEIDESSWGRGLGRSAMLAAEQIARSNGWTDIGLNVFGPNERARGLYDSLGYSVVNTNMTKALDG